MSALAGITVLDLGQAYMAPYCGLMLQRLGADVIKVEPPQGEPYRRPSPRKGVESVQFGLLNAGKRSLTLDLKDPEGRELFVELAGHVDVVLQNFAPGTFDRLIGIDRLLEVNPRLIVASGVGFPSHGPHGALKGMDLTIQAMSGVMATTGFEDGPPVRTGPAVVDFLGGTHLLAAILAALVQRGTTGAGQHIEVSLYDSVIPSMASIFGAHFDADGTLPQRTGNRHSGLSVAPYNVYETADGWLTILCLHDGHWRSLCELIGRPELAESGSGMDSPARRVAAMDEVDAVVGAWTRQHPTDELIAGVTAASVPCAKVMGLTDVLADPQLIDGGMLRHHENAERDWWSFGSPMKLSRSPVPQEPVPSRLGEHTDAILTETLQLSPQRLDALREAGVTAAHPPAYAERV